MALLCYSQMSVTLCVWAMYASLSFMSRLLKIRILPDCVPTAIEPASMATVLIVLIES